jgi:hypothetical protein
MNTRGISKSISQPTITAIQCCSPYGVFLRVQKLYNNNETTDARIRLFKNITLFIVIRGRTNNSRCVRRVVFNGGRFTDRFARSKLHHSDITATASTTFSLLNRTVDFGSNAITHLLQFLFTSIRTMAQRTNVQTCKAREHLGELHYHCVIQVTLVHR